MEKNHAASRVQVRGLREEVRQLRERVRSLGDANVSCIQDVPRRHPGLSQIPIASDEAFRGFNLDGHAHHALVSHLSTVGGSTVKDAVYNVMSKLLHRNFSARVVATDAGAARTGKLSCIKLQSIVIGNWH